MFSKNYCNKSWLFSLVLLNLLTGLLKSVYLQSEGDIMPPVLNLVDVLQQMPVGSSY